VVGESASSLADHNELLQLFKECIETVRNSIMKSRLKSETYSAKNSSSVVIRDSEATGFEESLLRLAQLKQGKIKLDDFTARDKYHLLDLFVNNDRTLMKVYEALFSASLPD
jgi:hypothetical protein